MFAKRVNMQYIVDNKASWSHGYDDKDKWVYYWVGNFKTGKYVKVSALEHLRYRVEQLEFENHMYQREIHNLQSELAVRGF